MSIVEANRRELEKAGEYVIRANATTGWFAVFPKKLEACISRARVQSRPDFNLVVYRTVSGDDRDHWTIPYSIVAEQFTKASLTHSTVNGVERWNCTFRNGVLHVTHTGRELDCSRFHGLPLLNEIFGSVAPLPEEVAGHEMFAEGTVARIFVNRYERDAGARAQCIAIHGSMCVVCGFDFAVVYGPSLRGFIHVHHLIPLHQVKGTYNVNPKSDLVPVCPNCHAVIHSKRKPLSVEAVRLLLKGNCEPRGAANGNPPIRSKTKRTSPAAGSRH